MKTRIAIIEVGGTVGDIESQPFLEAIRQFQHDVGHENAILIHVTLIPYLKASGEMKTKPTQASVKELQGMGIQPDVLVCRSEYPLDRRNRKTRSPCSVMFRSAMYCRIWMWNIFMKHLLPWKKRQLAQMWYCECLQTGVPANRILMTGSRWWMICGIRTSDGKYCHGRKIYRSCMTRT